MSSLAGVSRNPSKQNVDYLKSPLTLPDQGFGSLRKHSSYLRVRADHHAFGSNYCIQPSTTFR